MESTRGSNKSVVTSSKKKSKRQRQKMKKDGIVDDRASRRQSKNTRSIMIAASQSPNGSASSYSYGDSSPNVRFHLGGTDNSEICGDGSPCPECGLRPSQINCVHCSRILCKQCVSIHMEPLMQQAREMVKRAPNGAQEMFAVVDIPKDGASPKKDPAVNNSEGNAILEQHLLQRAMGKSASVENKTVNGALSALEKRGIKISTNSNQVSEEAVKSYFGFKQELNDKVCSRYFNMLSIQEIRLVTFLAEYVSTRLFPYLQCLAGTLYFRRHTERFAEFYKETMDLPVKKVPREELIKIQKICQNFVYIHKCFQRELVPEPAQINISPIALQMLETKLRICTQQLRNSGFHERKMRDFSIIKVTPFVEFLKPSSPQVNSEFQRHPIAKYVVFSHSDLGDQGAIRAETLIRHTVYGWYCSNWRTLNDHMAASTERLDGEPYKLSDPRDSLASVRAETIRQYKSMPDLKDCLHTRKTTHTLTQLKGLEEIGKLEQAAGNLRADSDVIDLMGMVLQQYKMIHTNASVGWDLTFGTKPPEVPDTLPESNSDRCTVISAWADPGDPNYEAHVERLALEKAQRLPGYFYMNHEELFNATGREIRSIPSSPTYLIPEHRLDKVPLVEVRRLESNQIEISVRRVEKHGPDVPSIEEIKELEALMINKKLEPYEEWKKANRAKEEQTELVEKHHFEREQTGGYEHVESYQLGKKLLELTERREQAGIDDSDEDEAEEKWETEVHVHTAKALQIGKKVQADVHKFIMDQIEGLSEEKSEAEQAKQLDEKSQADVHMIKAKLLDVKEPAATHSTEEERATRKDRSAVHRVEKKETEEKEQAEAHSIEVDQLDEEDELAVHSVEKEETEESAEAKTCTTETKRLEWWEAKQILKQVEKTKEAEEIEEKDQAEAKEDYDDALTKRRLDLLANLEEVTSQMTQSLSNLNRSPLEPRSENATVFQHKNYTVVGCNLGHIANGRFIPSLDDTDIDPNTPGLPPPRKSNTERRRERRNARANSKGGGKKTLKARAAADGKQTTPKKGFRIVDLTAPPETPEASLKSDVSTTSECSSSKSDTSTTDGSSRSSSVSSSDSEQADDVPLDKPQDHMTMAEVLDAINELD